MKAFPLSLGIFQCGRSLSYLLSGFFRSDWLMPSPRISPKRRAKWCAIRRDVDPSGPVVTWSNQKTPDTVVQIQWRFVTRPGVGTDTTQTPSGFTPRLAGGMCSRGAFSEHPVSLLAPREFESSMLSFRDS